MLFFQGLENALSVGSVGAVFKGNVSREQLRIEQANQPSRSDIKPQEKQRRTQVTKTHLTRIAADSVEFLLC